MRVSHPASAGPMAAETADPPGNCRAGLQGLILPSSEVSLALVTHRDFFPGEELSQ